MSDEFSDLLAANEAFAGDFDAAGTAGPAAKRLCVLTCMDSRLDPWRMLGLRTGDAKVLRNAGARVTEEVLRTLVLARYLLDVERVMVVAHTRCAMASRSEPSIHQAIAARRGPDTRSLSFLTSADPVEALEGDVQRIRSSPYLAGLQVGGFVYDVDTGRVRQAV
ncbi:MAG: beta-class carbonic anhydrase [Acidimicrobiales bacterium]